MMREPAKRFQTTLAAQVITDMEAYFREFPNERENIRESDEGGFHVITRTRNETANYSYLCQVRSAIATSTMVLTCMFPHRQSLDRTFNLILTAEGAVELSGITVAGLSKYLLAPVLFDRLIPDDPPEPSEGD